MSVLIAWRTFIHHQMSALKRRPERSWSIIIYSDFFSVFYGIVDDFDWWKQEKNVAVVYLKTKLKRTFKNELCRKFTLHHLLFGIYVYANA